MRIVFMGVAVNASSEGFRRVKFFDVDQVIFQSPKEPFGSFVIQRLALAIH